LKEAIINDRAIAIGEIADLLSQLRALTYAKVAHDTQIVAAQARAVVEREATLNSPPGGAKSEENSPTRPARAVGPNQRRTLGPVLVDTATTPTYAARGIGLHMPSTRLCRLGWSRCW